MESRGEERRGTGEGLGRETTAHRMNRLLAEAQERVFALVDERAPARPPIAPSRALRNLLLALLGMGVVWWGLGKLQEHFLPGAVFDEGSMQRFKVRQFADRGDEFDLVFVGTSRVYREFDPRQFDAIVTEAGQPLRSFNFGLRGMPLPEMRQRVEWILARKPAHLRYVVMELTGDLTRTFGRPLHRENAYTDRVVAWHDAKETRFLIRAVLASGESRSFKLDAVSTHLMHLARRFTFTGVGLPLARILLGYREEKPAHPWPASGQITFEEEFSGDPVAEAGMKRWLKTFRADRSEFDTLLRELEQAHRAVAPNPDLVEALRDVAAEVRAAGAQPIFVLMPPHWADGLEGLAGAAVDSGAPLFDYGDPERYPEFYDFENLYNVRHLNGKGTVLFTRTFAGDFLRLTGSVPAAKD